MGAGRPPSKIIHCPNCNESKPHYSLGKCKSCYRREWYNRPETKKKFAAYKLKDTDRPERNKKDYKRRILCNLEYLKTIYTLKCERCGYDKYFIALDFHHLDSSQKKTKRDTMSYWLKAYSLKSFKEKVKQIKFKILCATCHREIHFEEGETNAIGCI